MKKKPIIRTKTGETIEVPVRGSLGLLALGHIGLMLWRKKRQAVAQEQANNNQNNS